MEITEIIINFVSKVANQKKVLLVQNIDKFIKAEEFYIMYSKVIYTTVELEIYHKIFCSQTLTIVLPIFFPLNMSVKVLKIFSKPLVTVSRYLIFPSRTHC